MAEEMGSLAGLSRSTGKNHTAGNHGAESATLCVCEVATYWMWR